MDNPYEFTLSDICQIISSVTFTCPPTSTGKEYSSVNTFYAKVVSYKISKYFVPPSINGVPIVKIFFCWSP